VTGRTEKLMRLDGRTALITGAAGHLGRVIADTLAELGAALVLVDRPGSGLEEVAASVGRAWGREATPVYADLESADARAELVRRAPDPAPSVLVNNAAFVGTSALEGWAVPFELQSVEAWRRALEVNLTAVFDLCRGLIPAMAGAPGASVINIASIYGFLGPDWGLYEGTEMASPAAYAASKGGLLQLTRWLATTGAPAVRVNAISPGGIQRGQPESFRRRYAARTPLGRMATEDDLRGAVAFLATDLSAYVTGQNLLVDGGWSAW
jgi:NAD(P)-dependent dehydrogenase (short-subunit alcohol dehydrogenase family)